MVVCVNSVYRNIICICRHHQKTTNQLCISEIIRFHKSTVSIAVHIWSHHEELKFLVRDQPKTNGHNKNILSIKSVTEFIDFCLFRLVLCVVWSLIIESGSLALCSDYNFCGKGNLYIKWQRYTSSQFTNESRSLYYRIPLLRNRSNLLYQITDNLMQQKSIPIIKYRSCYVSVSLLVNAASEMVHSIYELWMLYACTRSAGCFIIIYIAGFYRFLAVNLIKFICSLHSVLYLWTLPHLFTQFDSQTADQYLSNITKSYLTVLGCTAYFLSTVMMTSDFKWLKHFLEQKNHNTASITVTIQITILSLQATLVVRYHSLINLTNRFVYISVSIINLDMEYKITGPVIIMYQAFVYNDFNSQFSENRTSNTNTFCLSYIFTSKYFFIFPYDWRSDKIYSN